VAKLNKLLSVSSCPSIHTRVECFPWGGCTKSAHYYVIVTCATLIPRRKSGSNIEHPAIELSDDKQTLSWDACVVIQQRIRLLSHFMGLEKKRRYRPGMLTLFQNASNFSNEEVKMFYPLKKYKAKSIVA